MSITSYQYFANISYFKRQTVLENSAICWFLCNQWRRIFLPEVTWYDMTACFFFWHHLQSPLIYRITSDKWSYEWSLHGPLARYVKLRVARAPGMPGTFSPSPRVSDPDMLHGTCVAHVPWCMSGSLTSGFLWNRWRGKRSRHFRRMRNPQLCVSGKRPIGETDWWDFIFV